MKPSLEKLYKFFNLEIEREYDNHAVMGGLDRILGHWQSEARADGLSEELIQFVIERIKNYPRLSPSSRAEMLEGIWVRIQRNEEISETLQEYSKETTRFEDPLPQDASEQVDSAEQPVNITIIQRDLPDLPGPTQPAETKQAETVALNASVIILPGVGPRYAQNLERLDLRTLRDLLYYFPRRYDDYSQLKPINRLKYGDEVTVIGTLQNIHQRAIQNGKNQIVEAVLSDGTGSLRIVWFNQIWIAKRLHTGSHIVLSGKIDQYLGRLLMNNPEWEPLEQQQLNTNRIVPVYALTAQISQRWLRKIMNEVVSYCAPRVFDPLPGDLRRSAGLMDLSSALLQVHFPDTWDKLNAARQRLAFDEIFLLQLGVLKQKYAWQDHSARIFQSDPQWMKMQLDRLPFILTGAQKLAIQDIEHDLASGTPMNRLIQGDVGSGKTIVSALAIAIVTHEKSQAAIMAPTSILADQHYKNMLNVLAGVGNTPPQSGSNDETLPAPGLSPEQIRLLVGSTPEGEKQAIRSGLVSGEIRLVVGTHALIEDPIQFDNLQLIIVDEQHRFGVNQRAKLRAKGENPHLLVMTATPIPRSLALTVYGDLDLTVIDEMPPGRQSISTHILMPRERERAYALIRNQVQNGRQAFIVHPLVEESERSDAQSAVEGYQRLDQEYFPDLRVGLLHGRMSPDEKDQIMLGFRNQEFDILASTSVIEVGVDIPNATVMLIEGANHFGLAQLHQFRGRVGRGSEQSYCLLIPDNQDQVENERLKAMVETNDGFVLAERDLDQRGPGEFLGSRQSGFSELKLAKLTDVKLIENARRHAIALFERDPNLSSPELQPLKAALEHAWGETEGDIS